MKLVFRVYRRGNAGWYQHLPLGSNPKRRYKALYRAICALIPMRCSR